MPSTVIKSHEYLPDKQLLLITFITGKRYEYLDVTLEEYNNFKGAFSKGTFFNKFIKPNHRFIKLKE